MFEFVMNLEAYKGKPIQEMVLRFMTSALRDNELKMTHFAKDLQAHGLIFERKAKSSFFSIISKCIQQVIACSEESKDHKFKPQLEYAYHPPNGRYEISRNGNSLEFIDSKCDYDDEVYVLAPGVCYIPDRNYYGTLFCFNWDKNQWVEIYMTEDDEKKVKNWNPTEEGTSCKKKPDPVYGQFCYMD